MHDQFFDQIIRDHGEIKTLLSEMLDSSNRSKRGELKNLFEAKFLPHMRAEEAVFYPALKEIRDSRNLALEAIEEHHAAELILNEVLNIRPQSEAWLPKCEVLKTLIEHHISEEESQIFKVARELISEEQAGKMLTNFAEEKMWYTGRITGEL
ncbi:hemerythrin domain-containing protein [Chitinispirillales bacterium ANBcel5]|uniref:hemerythrin domain-containing protein n=1 Tax=Cellulosispirillum alkaliphilum TaxID=3039283 RepID=UPI002A504A71|nr:hemerythrin domain-containing protein [Chitinispirillales bacterium ANBcel5]